MDTFSFRAPPVPLHRRVDARLVKASLAVLVLLVALVAFSRWVIESERRSEAAAATLESDAPVVGMLPGVDAVNAEAAESLPELDAPARADARTALAVAREAMRGGKTAANAGPGELSALEDSLVFTDGPSPAPGIVSVANVGERWAGAVMGASGVCYWVSAGPSGVGFGTGESCTGIAALSAAGSGWTDGPPVDPSPSTSVQIVGRPPLPHPQFARFPHPH